MTTFEVAYDAPYLHPLSPHRSQGLHQGMWQQVDKRFSQSIGKTFFSVHRKNVFIIKTFWLAFSLFPGMGFIHKNTCDVRAVEFARAFRVTATTIEPISFKVRILRLLQHVEGPLSQSIYVHILACCLRFHAKRFLLFQGSSSQVKLLPRRPFPADASSMETHRFSRRVVQWFTKVRKMWTRGFHIKEKQTTWFPEILRPRGFRFVTFCSSKKTYKLLKT